MSDFHPFNKDLVADPSPKILVIVDRDQTYGDFWRVCLTAEAQEREMKEINAAAEEARLLAEAIEAERLRVEEEARKAATAVYDDSPIVAKAYESETREATFDDVAALDVVPERPLMQFQLSRPADSIGEPRVFADLSADNEMFTESRSTKNPDFALERKEMSVSVQACKVKVETGSQTWTRPIQASTQYHPVGNAYQLPPPPPESKRERQASRQKLVNGKKGQVEEDTSLMTEEQLNERKKAAERDRSYAHLARFLSKTFGLMENALEQNETVDVFGDLFKGTGAGAEDLEASKGALGELKELRTFADINRTKGKHLHALQWHPSRKGVVAVGPRSNATFEERLQSYGFSSSSHVLYWDFADLITPLLVLEAPYSVEAFAINEERPHLVCGGLENGQVLVWDTSAATEAIDAKRQREKRRLAGESTKEDEEAALFDDEVRPPLECVAMASLGDHKTEHCHRRTVTQVLWLPRNAQIDYKGRLLDSEYQGDYSNQFVSISLDGQLLFWDLRFEDIARGKHPKIGRRMRGSTDVGPDGKLPQVPWQPLWRCHLAHPVQGELGLCHMVNSFVGVNDDPVPSTEEDVPDLIPDHRCKFVACSEDGELLSGDWAATSEDDSEPSYVSWASKDHPRPALALQQCPLLRDHLLTCAERHFHIWLYGQKQPAFKSPRTAKLSCVAWSPTRAGVVFCGRSDGGLDIWDLCDDPERPIGSFRVASSAITSMSFQSDLLPGEYDQLLALGDEQGNLHVFDVPLPLRKAKANDVDTFKAFIQAEIDWEVKSQERMAAQKEAAESAKAAAPAEDEEVVEEEAEDTPKEGEFAFSPEELEADNAAYAKLQRKLAQEMDIRLLENGLRDWSYEPQPEQPAQ